MNKKYDFQVPRSRNLGKSYPIGIASATGAPSLTNNPSLDNVRDLIIYAALCRVARKDNSTEEFRTFLEDGVVDIDIPQDVLDDITSVAIGPKMEQYFAWLTASLPNLRRETLQFTIGDGGGITTGLKGIGLQVATDSTIERVDIFSSTTGSAAVDIWKAPAAEYPPTVVDSITNGQTVDLVGAQSAIYNDVDVWDQQLERGDVLFYNIDSASGVDLITIVLHVCRNNIVFD